MSKMDILDIGGGVMSNNMEIQCRNAIQSQLSGQIIDQDPQIFYHTQGSDLQGFRDSWVVDILVNKIRVELYSEFVDTFLIRG